MTMTTTAEDRLRAARIQAGYNRREDLAEQITLPRFGKEVLGQVERGERPLFEHEAVELGRILDVEADWLMHGTAQPASLEEINAKLDAIIRHLGIDAEEFARAVEAGAATVGENGPVSRPRASVIAASVRAAEWHRQKR
jgi:transcriptional regulator with XRE-family HTH domain